MEFKENIEARTQREMSIRFDSMLAFIRDQGLRNGLSENEIQEACLRFIDQFGRGNVDFDSFNPFASQGPGGRGDNKRDNDVPGMGDRKAEAEKNQAKVPLDNQEELNRYKKEIKIFMEDIFSRYRCPMLLGIPDEAPVRLPTHPGVLKLKQQIWDRNYISNVDKCPITRAVLPRAWWGVDPYVNAEGELFLFLVASQAWLQTIPASLMDENSEIGKELRKARDEVAEVLAKANHGERIKTAQATLAVLKAGGVVPGMSNDDRNLLNFLIRGTEDEQKIRQEEEKARAERFAARQAEERKQKEEEEKRKQETLARIRREAEEGILKKQMLAFQNMVTIFQCPMETEFPKYPVRIINHPSIPQRRQLYLQANTLKLVQADGTAHCPFTRAPLNLAAAGALGSARPVLCLFAIAAGHWIVTLPGPVMTEVEGVYKEIQAVLHEPLNADYLPKATEIYTALKAGRAVSVADLSKDDEELLGFLVRSPESEMKLRAEEHRREVERLLKEEQTRRELAGRAAAEDLRRREEQRRLDEAARAAARAGAGAAAAARPIPPVMPAAAAAAAAPVPVAAVVQVSSAPAVDLCIFRRGR